LKNEALMLSIQQVQLMAPAYYMAGVSHINREACPLGAALLIVAIGTARLFMEPSQFLHNHLVADA
jgi:hypothetical protein